MVAQNPIRPSSRGKSGLILIDQACERASVPFGREECKVIGKVDAIEIAAVVRDKTFDRKINFTEQNSIGELV
jgi:hypothetical protein